jgi:hypothetical protein
MCDNETEPFTNVFATLTLTAAADSADVTLISYSIQYLPLESADGSGGTVMPPELAQQGDGYAHFDVASGQSAAFRFTCMSIDTKEEYVNYRPAGLEIGRYRIIFTFHFRSTTGEDIDVTIDRTAYLGNYDNC